MNLQAVKGFLTEKLLNKKVLIPAAVVTGVGVVVAVVKRRKSN